MAFKLIDREWNREIRSNIDTYLMDSLDDLAMLPCASAGSTAIAPVEGKTFVMDASGEWKEE